MSVKTNILSACAGMGLIFAACAPQPTVMEKAFADAENVVNQIVVPTFCDTLLITDFGASTDNDALANQKAISEAIAKASSINGACVVVPQGEWLTGPITLQTGVNLVVSEGAVLKFSTEYAHYFPVVKTRWEGIDCYNMHPLIYADGAANIAITGKGVIDGQGSPDIWWFMKGRREYGYQEGMISQGNGGRDSLIMFDRVRTPLANRVMSLQSGLRPQLINICNSKNVLIQDVTLKNSPFWVIHPLFVENLTVKGVKIESHGPNSDGCDPESCKNVLIEDCFFDTGDDCIAIKSGRNFDGREHARPSENIVVRNCRMKNGHGGVVVGSEISGGFRNLWVENCKMDSPELDRVVRIKTSNCRGGVIENIFVRNIEVGECNEAILKINLQYEPNEKCDRSFPPVVQNVNLENVTSKKSKFGVYIIGMEEMPQNVNSVTVKDCVFNGVENKCNSVKHATDVDLSGAVLK